jgi:hypothetical protein
MRQDLRPPSRRDVAAFMALYYVLCPTHAHEVPVIEFARRLGWTDAKTCHVAAWLAERGMIETDAGLGEEIRIIEGRSGS